MSFMSFGMWWRAEYDGERAKENFLGFRGVVQLDTIDIFTSPTLMQHEDAVLLRRQFAERLREVLS